MFEQHYRWKQELVYVAHYLWRGRSDIAALTYCCRPLAVRVLSVSSAVSTADRSVYIFMIMYFIPANKKCPFRGKILSDIFCTRLVNWSFQSFMKDQLTWYSAKWFDLQLRNNRLCATVVNWRITCVWCNWTLSVTAGLYKNTRKMQMGRCWHDGWTNMAWFYSVCKEDQCARQCHMLLLSPHKWHRSMETTTHAQHQRRRCEHMSHVHVWHGVCTV